MNWTISKIVSEYFTSVPSYALNEFPGWSLAERSSIFVEPGLASTPNDGKARIWLVSAPGAVGKSTYAKELAAAASAIYVDLAQTGAIGANFLTGGVQKINLSPAIQPANMALIIDSLDEAYLRVTFDSIRDFFDDVAYNASRGAYPLILFGRPSAIELAQLILEDKGHPVNIFEIQYFTREQAIEFILKYISSRDSTEIPHKDILIERIIEVLDWLDKAANSEDRSFSGYAPVLEAIARFFTAERNYSISPITSTGLLKDHILESICRNILQREHEKVLAAVAKIASSPVEVYSPKEQMQALCQICAGINPAKIDFHVETDDKALVAPCQKIAREFIETHPFLKDDLKPANATFAAAIQSYALKNGLDSPGILSPATLSPLFAEFYFNDHLIYEEEKPGADGREAKPVPLSHLPFILESLHSLLPPEYELDCSLDDVDEQEAGEGRDIEASISLRNKPEDSERELHHFFIRNDSPIIFNRSIPCALSVDCPDVSITLRAEGGDFSLSYPLSLEVDMLVFECQTLVLLGDIIIHIQANNVQADNIKIEKLGNADAYINWTGSEAWPWSQFHQIELAGETDNDQLGAAFNALRRIALVFQANRNKTIARLRAKLDNKRLSRNYGKLVKEHMLANGVLRINGRLYTMDTRKFADVYDLSFDDISRRKISEKAKAVLRGIA